MREVDIAYARRNLGALLDEVAAGAEIVILVDGVAKAKLVPLSTKTDAAALGAATTTPNAG